METRPDQMPARREVGGYRLLDVLGSGGMGTVYEALDGEGRAVALKLLHPGISADPSARARLQREIAALHRVRGPHVARVLDAESDSPEAFIVTELVDGQSLDQSVHEHGPLDEVELADLADGLADALEAIHAAGVVHRDLKPGNVMLTDSGPVVIDFGISQLADDARLTQTGLVTGTPGYVDPAVMRGAAPGPVGDWWGWAAVLLFAATGRPPFGKGPLAAVLGRVETGRPDLDGVPSALAPVLRAALHPDPQQRLEPKQVRRALGEFALGRTPTVVLAPGQGDPTVPAPASGAPTTPVPAGPTAPPVAAAPAAPPDAHPPHRVSAWGGEHERYPGQDQLPPAGPEWRQAPVTPAPGPHTPAPLPPAGHGQQAGYPQQVGYPQQADQVPAWARAPRARPAVVGAWFLAVVGLGVVWPIWAVIALVVVVALTGAVGVGSENLRERRLRLGPRRSDTARVIAGVPWYLISGTLLAVPGLLVGGLAAVVIWALGASRFPQSGVVAVAMVVLTLLVWWTPSSRSARAGTRRLLSALAPNARLARLWAGLGLLVAVAMAVAVLGFGVPVAWSPASPPPVPQF